MLYIVPTPIGNLEDMTYRGVRVLKECDLICCEDTRTSQVLLKHYGIDSPTRSYHKFNEKEALDGLLDLLRQGKDLALISDAGMPGIQDPGRILIQACIQEGLDYTVLPGPSAGITAFIASGFLSESFEYIGFLPEKSGKRKKALEEIKDHKEPMIFYEAPHRIQACLEDMREVLGPRQVFLGRELTKKFEDYQGFNLGEDFQDRVKAKGEFVVIVEGDQTQEEVDIQAALRDCLQEGMKVSQAVKEVAKTYGLAKNHVYKESLKL